MVYTKSHAIYHITYKYTTQRVPFDRMFQCFQPTREVEKNEDGALFLLTEKNNSNLADLLS